MKLDGAMGRIEAWCSRPGSSVLLALLAITVLDDIRSEVLTVYDAYHVVPEDFPGIVRFAYTDGSHVLFVVALACWLFGLQRAFRATAVSLLGLVTFFLALDVGMLIVTLGTRSSEGGAFSLLWDAFLVWTANVLIFTIWYWMVDRWKYGSSPRAASTPRDLWFPQQETPTLGGEHWQPGFIDYLFLAFNTSVAFSVTHTQFISGRTKVLMMVQALTSLIIMVILAARVVNIIP
ncbi:MAG TPA: hypothetical protein VK066_06110 [Chloroflexota bacterium]|nr:hypothetical protein [Chloroflexota bacterium]